VRDSLSLVVRNGLWLKFEVDHLHTQAPAGSFPQRALDPRTQKSASRGSYDHPTTIIIGNWNIGSSIYYLPVGILTFFQATTTPPLKIY
jgi:hypothetical protein